VAGRLGEELEVAGREGPLVRGTPARRGARLRGVALGGGEGSRVVGFSDGPGLAPCASEGEWGTAPGLSSPTIPLKYVGGGRGRGGGLPGGPP